MALSFGERMVSLSQRLDEPISRTVRLWIRTAALPSGRRRQIIQDILGGSRSTGSCQQLSPPLPLIALAADDTLRTASRVIAAA